MNKTELKDCLVDFMRRGIKETRRRLIGMEAEHFIVQGGSFESVPYEGKGGVKEVLVELLQRIPGSIPLPGENLLGFRGPGYVITLEPAAQLEISIDMTSDIHEVERIYRGFLTTLQSVLDAHGYRFLSTGTQPVSKVRSLSLIPKERYRLMDRYFSNTGTGGIEMMRGTCSVQVSIDYYSEEDFGRKVRAASFYSPVFKFLSDNSRCFEGEKTSSRLYRTDIWNRTDPRRCGVLPGAFKENYRFSDYAGFLLDMPLIYREEGKECIDTGVRTVREIFEGSAPDEEEIIHIQSMAFPDVRVKQYLELRAADAMPTRYALAYSALVKGLMYSEEGLSYAEQRIRERGLFEEDIVASEKSLMENGDKGRIYGTEAEEIAGEIVSLAGEQLPPEEKDYLTPFRERNIFEHMKEELIA